MHSEGFPEAFPEPNSSLSFGLKAQGLGQPCKAFKGSCRRLSVVAMPSQHWLRRAAAGAAGVAAGAARSFRGMV